MRVASVLAAFIAVSTLFAGCADNAGPETDANPDGVVDHAGMPLQVMQDAEGNFELNRPLIKNDTLDKPVPWSIGDRYGVHVFIGPDDTEGIHFNCIVVSETAQDWMLAADTQQAAKEEAVWDYPILGPVSKTQLTTSGFGGDWPLYEFPMSDGKTWTGNIAMGFDKTMKIEFEAKFNPSITTATSKQPGFDIRGVDSAANLVLEYNYVPELGWFTQFNWYNPEDGTLEAKAISMGFERDWTGTYYLDTAAVEVEHHNLVGVDPDAPGTYYDDATPPSKFQVDADDDYLVGFVFSFAFAGSHVTELVAPDNTERHFPAYSAVAVQEYSEVAIDEAAKPGEWQVATAGAGVVVGGGAFLWTVKENSFTLNAAP